MSSKTKQRVLWIVGLIMVLAVILLQSGVADHLKGFRSILAGRSDKQSTKPIDKSAKLTNSGQSQEVATASPDKTDASSSSQSATGAEQASAKETADTNRSKTVARTTDADGRPIQRASQDGYTPAFQGGRSIAAGQSG